MNEKQLKLSPQQLSLMIFRSNGLNDFEVKRNLPRLSNTDNAIKFQRENYRKAVNLIILSLSRVIDYVSNSNIRSYFPNLYVMAYYLQNSKQNSKALRDTMVKSSLYVYDKESKWEILEAVLIVFIMNRLQSNERYAHAYDGKKENGEKISTYYHRGFSYSKDFNGDTNSYFYEQIVTPRKNKLLKEQMNAAIYELANLDKYVCWLLENSSCNTSSSLNKSANNNLDYFLAVSGKIEDLLDNDLIKKDQISNLYLNKNTNNIDQVVNEIVKEFSNQITSWRNNDVLSGQGIRREEYDFDWEDSNYLLSDILSHTMQTNSLISIARKNGLDPYSLYPQFSDEDGFERLLKSKGKDCIELKLYKWLTVSHYMSIIIMESLIPGTLDGLQGYLECDYDGIRVIGVNIVDSFADYLDNLVGYGREF